MKTLTITVKNSSKNVVWEVIGEMPIMNTLEPTPTEGGWVIEIPNGSVLASGGILHHLRQLGHFTPTPFSF